MYRAHFRAAHVRIRTLIRIADTCFVFIVRQNVSGQTMGRVEQRRYLLERAERRGGYFAGFLLKYLRYVYIVKIELHRKNFKTIETCFFYILHHVSSLSFNYEIFKF